VTLRHYGNALVAAVAGSILLAGCGGSSASGGKALFAHNCSGCHSLSGVESPRRQGGDLLHANFSRTVMIQFAREMPVRKPLTEADLQRIADYVLSVQRRAR
jgi:mono/diheme cytochrome c family protein